MKQTFLMLSAITGALLTGCSNEEIANVDNLPQNAISFHLVGNAAETRATPITPSNLKETDFDVFAYTSDRTAFMGKTDIAFMHDGVKIVYKNGKWDYDDPSELHYWPSDTLDFYAVSPASLVNGDPAMHYTWNFNYDSQQIHYFCLDEYNNTITDPNLHANHDVMYGIAKKQTKETNSGVVKFTFKHILSQVVFKAKTELSTMNVTINKITIKNINRSGVFTLPKEATTAPSSSNWTSNMKANTVIVMDKNIEVNSDTTATDISSKTPIFTIPQELTKWAVEDNATKTKENADKAQQSYLEIACKIKQSNIYVLGSDSSYETIYVPFGADWQPGKRYIYTLIFGGGYNDQGEPILTPIQFDAETTDWVDDAGNDHEI